MELVVGNQIYIAKDGLHPGLRNRLLRLAAFQNPEFYKAQSMRLSTYDKPRVIACAEDHAHHIGLPRGCLDELRDTLQDLGICPTVRDERHAGRLLNAAFQGELRREQQVAAEAILAHDTGMLAATTAFGKTVMGAWLIAKRGVVPLVLVHRRQLLNQWVERLSTFLGVPAKSIGRIGGGRNTPTGLLDVAVIQSLVKKGIAERSLLVEDVKIGCTLGMLQCLDRPHRLAYVLGEILELSGPESAEALGISAELFRKRLQHARSAIEAFTRTHCGLASDSAACACHRPVPAALRLGRIRPDALGFAKRPSSFQETRELVRQVEQARWALQIHRGSHPGASAVDFAHRIAASFDSPQDR